VRRENKKNGLDGIDNVLSALSSGVLYSFASFTDGDILEFGTQTGRTSAVLAHNIKLQNKNLGRIFGSKKLHLFDSFVGLPDPFNNSVDSLNLFTIKGVWRKNSLTGINQKKLNNVIRRTLPKDDYVIYSGFFSETLASFSAKCALLHIDSDLYSSAHEILDSLFSRNLISNGCCIMFDDYDLDQANPNSGERRAWDEAILKYQVQYSDHGSYGLFAHKFIIHSYTSGIN
jgi:hypothetical protein